MALVLLVYIDSNLISISSDLYNIVQGIKSEKLIGKYHNLSGVEIAAQIFIVMLKNGKINYNSYKDIVSKVESSTLLDSEI